MTELFAADQPVERASTLDDIRAEVLSPERLNALVSGVFAAVALLIAVGEGAAMAIGGLALGLASGYWLTQLATSVVGEVKMPGVLPVAGSAVVLLLAAVAASAIPAFRAARVDVIRALRTEWLRVSRLLGRPLVRESLSPECAILCSVGRLT